MRRVIQWVLVGGLLAVGAAPVMAQDGGGGLREVHVRRGDGSGLWGTLALGYGNEGFRFDSMTTYESDFSAPTFTFKLGGTPSRFFKLGAELSAWYSAEGGTYQTLSNLLFIAQWYPLGRLAYLKGGVGLTNDSQHGYDSTLGGYYRYRDNGYGGVVGIGVDIPVARRVALSPELNVYGQRYPSADPSNRYRERLVTFGLGFTFK